MTLELKSELVRTRGPAANQVQTDNFTDGIFSIDLEGIVDMMDPGRSQFTVMELLAYKIDPFPQVDIATGADEGWMTRISGNLVTAIANRQFVRQKSITLDTSVPDASQPTGIGNAFNQEERWLASATKIDRQMVSTNMRQSAGNSGTQGAAAVSMFHTSGSDFGRDWVNLEDEKGRGKLIVSPRLIVRYFQYIRSNDNILDQDNSWDVTFQFRMRYRTKKVNKNQMWQMLLQQTPGETLIRSGSTAFP